MALFQLRRQADGFEYYMKNKFADSGTIFILSLIFIIFGLYRGESAIQLLPIPKIEFLAPLLFLFFYKIKLLKRILMIIFFSMILLVSFFIGQKERSVAFNDCVKNSEYLRKSLSEYYDAHNYYPKHLSDLKINDIPGKLFLKGNICEYSPKKDSYNLEFSDWLITHSATESEEFMSHK